MVRSESKQTLCVGRGWSRKVGRGMGYEGERKRDEVRREKDEGRYRRGGRMGYAGWRNGDGEKNRRGSQVGGKKG